MVLRWLSELFKMPLTLERKLYAAIRCAAASQDEELVDVEEVSEETENKPKWLFGIEEPEGRKHRMIRVVVGKKKFQCRKCGTRRL